MNKYLSTSPLALSMLTLLMLSPSHPAYAQGMDISDLYISMDVGFSKGSSLDTKAGDNDLPTLCDNILDSDNHFSPKKADGSVVTEPADCPSGEGWTNSFDSSSVGVLAGFALGYEGFERFNGRMELEYLHTGFDYDEVSDPFLSGVTEDKSEQELVRSEERIGNVELNGFLANIYYDLPFRTAKTKFYVGAGAGFARAKVNISSVFARNSDYTKIKTANPENAVYNAANNPSGTEAAARKDFHERLAGTTTTANKTHDDTLTGFQIIFGAERALDENVSIGLKARWLQYSDFEGSGTWDQLRSHASNNGKGTNTVSYKYDIDDIEVLGLSANLRYSF